MYYGQLENSQCWEKGLQLVRRNYQSLNKGSIYSYSVFKSYIHIKATTQQNAYRITVQESFQLNDEETNKVMN